MLRLKLYAIYTKVKLCFVLGLIIFIMNIVKIIRMDQNQHLRNLTTIYIDGL